MALNLTGFSLWEYMIVLPPPKLLYLHHDLKYGGDILRSGANLLLRTRYCPRGQSFLDWNDFFLFLLDI